MSGIHRENRRGTEEEEECAGSVIFHYESWNWGQISATSCHTFFLGPQEGTDVTFFKLIFTVTLVNMSGYLLLGHFHVVRRKLVTRKLCFIGVNRIRETFVFMGGANAKFLKQMGVLPL